jgi:hypothetical protein
VAQMKWSPPHSYSNFRQIARCIQIGERCIFGFKGLAGMNMVLSISIKNRGHRQRWDRWFLVHGAGQYQLRLAELTAKPRVPWGSIQRKRHSDTSHERSSFAGVVFEPIGPRHKSRDRASGAWLAFISRVGDWVR